MNGEERERGIVCSVAWLVIIINDIFATSELRHQSRFVYDPTRMFGLEATAVA